jgi:CHAT domain-containing protein/tetratricopeptide (TPR) repeat protein
VKPNGAHVTLFAALVAACCGVGCTETNAPPKNHEELQPEPESSAAQPVLPDAAAKSTPRVEEAPSPDSPIVAEIQGLLEQIGKTGGTERKQLLATADRRSREFLSKAPTRDLVTATVCDQRVHVLWQDGRGEDSEIREVAQRAVDIKRDILSANDHRLASSLNTLATLSLMVGEYAEAKMHFYEAHGILETHAETQPLELANCKNNLGGLFHKIGDYAEARTHFEGALAIRERLHESYHPRVVSTRINLGQLLHEIGKKPGRRHVLEEARRCFERAEQGWTHESFQAPHQMSAGLNNYAYLLYDLGEKELARSKLVQAIKIREKTWGEEHADLAWSLGILAILEREQSRHQEAERLHKRALKVRRKAYRGNESTPHVSWDLKQFSISLLANGKPQEAVERAREAESIRRALLQLNLPRLSTELALSAASEAYSGLDAILSATCHTEDPAHVETAWDEVLRSRGLVLDEMAVRQRGIYETTGATELKRLVSEVESARSRVAELMVRGAQGKEAERALRAARKSRERAEEALAQASLPFRNSLRRIAGTWKKVRAGLPAGWALVSFVQFENTGGSPSGETTNEYAAFVLSKQGGTPQIVPLGPATPIESACTAWLTELARAATLPRSQLNQAERELTRRGTRLRTLVWDSIAPHLAGAQRVFVVPTGQLHLIPLAALPAESGRYLLESGPLIHYLATEKDVLYERTSEKNGRGLLTLGDADFECSTEPPEPTTRKAAALGTSRGVGELTPSIADEKSPSVTNDLLSKRLRFPPLKMTREESKAVAQLWTHSPFHEEPVTELFGKRATEQSFKELAPGQRVLHLATHGFFLAAAAYANDKGDAHQEPLLNPLTGEKPRADDNALALSGIALAGANRRGRSGVEMDDGIVLAEEIASLDLLGVDLAVLSACETGLGVIEKGEGVLGLRRAFQVAGVRTLVMALWTIDDAATTRWIGVFFRHLFVERETTPEALRAASLSLLEAGRRKEQQTTHPFFWGGFVAAGHWD